MNQTILSKKHFTLQNVNFFYILQQGTLCTRYIFFCFWKSKYFCLRTEMTREIILKDLTRPSLKQKIQSMFFFIPNFSHLKSKLLAFMFSKDTTRPCLYCGKPQQEETSQALFDYVGKNTKYIVICAAADWTKYSSVIIFVNFFFSFQGPIIYFIKDRIPSRHQKRNNALYRIFSAKMGFALLFHQTTSKNIRPPRHMKIEMKKFFLVDVCLFLKKTQKDRGSRKRGGWKYRYQKYIHSHCQKQHSTRAIIFKEPPVIFCMIDIVF